ncbi:MULTISPECIES: TadE/TadG family type IV pilus assembly protein [Bradyrhizobium]|uniref:Putative Flp pilus-assembly TadE/G-like n=1 Tax=Bradyrhizobium brasilense TaxID=1419277 RepID=A0A1G7PFY9_9BRAD|nr:MULTISPECIES: TadE/TadG family type IV pilus assembly protein [Bradyrhizobium]MCC8974415.1 pilus assembly protein [Bradyrhizobium brasilense]MCP1853306.1 Flp pilus assembly protein TadG [Bradyrhizobium sp. USDA 4541]SDF85171.1 Putative Flp pilus-assembly TadE/G-like [Bradyrhizobium brasilense]
MKRPLTWPRSLRKSPRGFPAQIKAIGTDQRGVAAVEFGLFVIILAVALANVTDVSLYIYQRMQLENATQAAGQAAWKTCDLSQLPATTNCPGLTIAIQNALQSTSLGTRVSMISGSPSEGYYCINSSNALQYVSNVTSKPADCSAAGMPTLQPGDYIVIQTTFSYAPLFPGLSIASGLPTPINGTAMIRLG